MPSVGMITLNMMEALPVQTLENAALLSSCHIENSRGVAALSGNRPRSLPIEKSSP
jgi:hypothetical protein